MELTIFNNLPLILLSVSFCATAQKAGAVRPLSASGTHGLPLFPSATCLYTRAYAGNSGYSYPGTGIIPDEKVAVTNETKHNKSNNQIS